MGVSVSCLLIPLGNKHRETPTFLPQAAVWEHFQPIAIRIISSAVISISGIVPSGRVIRAWRLDLAGTGVRVEDSIFVAIASFFLNACRQE